MYMVGSEGQQVPLCLDCYIKWQSTMQQELENHERQINFLTSHMESMVGFPGLLPKYPERRPIINTGGVTLNNINVTNSEVGVLNTGTIGNVDNTLTVLNKSGAQELASAVSELTEAVIKSGDLSNNQKNEVLEMVGTISEEAVAPKESRKLGVVKALIGQLTNLLMGIGNLGKAFETAKSAWESFFGEENA